MRMAPRAKKAPTNLSVRIDLVRRAKALGLNISELVDDALERSIVAAERAAWLAENREAIDAYNDRVAQDGVFSDASRRF
jgi:antitoxin CcdA